MKDIHENLVEIKKGHILQDDPLMTVLCVLHQTPQYIIYELKETGQVTYKTSSTFADNTYEIAMELDKVESFLGENVELWSQYKNTMADIYSLYLSNDTKKMLAAKKLLKRVDFEIQYNKYNKVYYLLPCLLAVGILAIGSLILKSFNLLIPPTSYTIDHEIIKLFYMMTFGSIGGLLSIAIYIDKHDEKFSRCTIQRVYAGLFRILISMLSGMIIYILFRSKLIPVLTESSNEFFEYALAIISGFSQNLVPDLANKLEKRVVDPTVQPPAPVN